MVDKDITGNASEFFVLAALLRQGADATLTLGNKKKVDIIVNKNGKALTIDVKGCQNGTSFPLNPNYKDSAKDKNHYFVFVDYENGFENWEKIPSIYVISSQDIEAVAHDYKDSKRQNALKSKVKEYTKDLSIFVSD